MMSIASTRQDVIDTVNGEVNSIRPETPVYGENIAQNVDAGILALVDDFSISGVIEGFPNITDCQVRLICFSFTSRYEADEIADAAIQALAGKQNQVFGVFTLQNFDVIEYDDTFGVFIDVLEFHVPIKNNSLRPE